MTRAFPSPQSRASIPTVPDESIGTGQNCILFGLPQLKHFTPINLGGTIEGTSNPGVVLRNGTNSQNWIHPAVAAAGSASAPIPPFSAES